MSAIKNRETSYLTRAKLASPKPAGSAKASASRVQDRPRRPIDYIDAAGYVHWKLVTKRSA